MKMVISKSEHDTRRAGETLAEALFKQPRAFVSLKGELGAGKTVFARGFIDRWLKLSQEPVTETVTSPSYNIAKIYGARAPLAHLDLYRLKAFEELEQIGFEHYFFEHRACLVEWLDQIPEAKASAPENTVWVEIKIGKGGIREITLEKNLKTAS